MRCLPLPLLLVCLVPIALSAAQAQPLPPPPAPTGPGALPPGPAAQPAVALAPADAGVQLWDDIRSLYITQGLAISAEQTAQIVPLLERYQTQRQATAEYNRQLWEQQWQPVTAVLNAWISGKQPEETLLAQADAVGKMARAATAALDELAQATATSIYGLLSTAQSALVETAEDARLREQAAAHYDGAPSLGHFVLRQIETQRSLMPDEYAVMRRASAVLAARKMVRLDDPTFPVVEAALLRLFDQVNDWTDEQYAQEKPKLPEQINQYLAVGAPATKPVRQEEFLEWVANPRTLAYLKVRGTDAQPAAPVPDRPDEMASALDGADTVSLLNDLQLTTPQLEQLIVPAQRAAADRSLIESSQRDAITAASPTLTNLLPLLVAARPLSQEASVFVSDLIDRLRGLRIGIDQAMAPHVATVRTILTPQQQAYVDWRVPPAIEAVASLEQQIELTEALRDAVLMLDSLHMVNRTEFYGTRRERVDEFLREHLDTTTRDFDRAESQILQELGEVFRMPTEEWEREAVPMALRVLEYAGVYTEEERRPSNLPLSWQDVCKALKDPQTVGLVQRMIQARTAG